MLLSAKALLDAHPHPTREQMADAISGNLCRCTGYTSIYEAIDRVSRATSGSPARSESASLERVSSPNARD
jgi:carbon-monoxide dehydrogenase small subunit